MNIVIIEDELPALNRMKKLVTEVAPEAAIMATADSIETAVELFGKYKNIDIALMDIELADGRSFEIFNRVEVTCPVIFTTAYDEFALQAFKVNSIDYLLKPVEADLLKQAFEKHERLKRNNLLTVPDLQQLVSLMKPVEKAYKSRFLVKVGTRWISVPCEEIAYFYAADKSVYLHTATNQKLLMDESLDQLMQVLNPSDFFHINRQVIASIQSIQSVHSHFNGKLKVELKPTTKEEVLVSRERASAFKSWLDR